MIGMLATPRTARPTAFRSGRELVARIQEKRPLATVELRPPRRASGSSGGGVEPWIDLYHAVRRLAALDTLIFTTDNAVGTHEEESIRHLSANVGTDADLSRVIPFLTTKHPLEYCLRFSERAIEAGHRAVVVLGGDQHDGVQRCFPHAVELRQRLRERYPSLALGGWANPYRDPAWQVSLLKREEGLTDFVLTQVVSHHDLPPIERFLAEAEKQALAVPVLFGVFYYRSGNLRTLEALRGLLPVPVQGLDREFAVENLDADTVCRRTLTALAGLGVDRIYLCNLPLGSAAARIGPLWPVRP